jgi:hypothetical protein
MTLSSSSLIRKGRETFRTSAAWTVVSSDLRDAVIHAAGCLECVARDVTGDKKATLGEIIKKHPGLVPRPLDTAIEKMWGYASNEARHVAEGQQPGREEAGLMVGIAATMATYLSKKADNRT